MQVKYAREPGFFRGEIYSIENIARERRADVSINWQKSGTRPQRSSRARANGRDTLFAPGAIATAGEPSKILMTFPSDRRFRCGMDLTALV